MQVTALMPIKKESERVVNKNKRLFAGQPLFQVLYHTLSESKSISKIIVNTDCGEVKDYFKSRSNVILIDRPTELSGHHVTMNTLIEHDINFTSGDHFFQTHCTNPLLSIKTIDQAISRYFSQLTSYDSLFSVNLLRARIYDEALQAINHDPARMERTQDLKAVYEENSNFFIFSRQSFAAGGNNRIGLKPFAYEMNKAESVDIDYEDDFILAELIYCNREKFSCFRNNLSQA